MTFSAGFTIFAIALIAAGLIFAYFKFLDDPERRFHKIASTLLNNDEGTINGDVFYLAVYDARYDGGHAETRIIDDIIINPNMIDPGNEYNIGRIRGNNKNRSLIQRLDYMLKNKDLLFGVKQPPLSHLGHKHLNLKSRFNTKNLKEIVLYCLHSNGMKVAAFDLNNNDIDRSSIDRAIANVNFENARTVPADQVIILSNHSSVLVQAGGLLFLFVKLTSAGEARNRLTGEYIQAHADINNRRRLSDRHFLNSDGTVPNNAYTKGTENTRPFRQHDMSNDRIIRR